MNRYVCIFAFMGVFLRIEMDTQGTKHNDIDPIGEACEALAKKLGATYLYREPA